MRSLNHILLALAISAVAEASLNKKHVQHHERRAALNVHHRPANVGEKCTTDVDCCSGTTCFRGYCKTVSAPGKPQCKNLGGSCAKNTDCCGTKVGCKRGRCSAIRGSGGNNSPGGNHPTDPNGGNPTDPNGGNPSDPNGGNNPTDPNGGNNPTDPNGGNNPTDPNGGNNPTDPNGGNPTDPNGNNPTDPNENNPPSNPGDGGSTDPNGNGGTDPNGNNPPTDPNQNNPPTDPNNPPTDPNQNNPPPSDPPPSNPPGGDPNNGPPPPTPQCIATGSKTCSASTDCCDSPGAICSSGTCKSCVAVGSSTRCNPVSNPCCDPAATCSGGRCSIRTCARVGELCLDTFPCCDTATTCSADGTCPAPCKDIGGFCNTSSDCCNFAPCTDNECSAGGNGCPAGWSPKDPGPPPDCCMNTGSWFIPSMTGPRPDKGCSGDSDCCEAGATCTVKPDVDLSGKGVCCLPDGAFYDEDNGGTVWSCCSRTGLGVWEGEVMKWQCIPHN